MKSYTKEFSAKSSKRIKTSQDHNVGNGIRSQSNGDTSFGKNMDKPKLSVKRTNKKYEDRKYSGDLKFTMFSNKKLFDKESDIKS